MGGLPGHNRTGSNILIVEPVNNTEYFCVESNQNGDIIGVSLPATLYFAGR